MGRGLIAIVAVCLAWTMPIHAHETANAVAGKSGVDTAKDEDAVQSTPILDSALRAALKLEVQPNTTAARATSRSNKYWGVAGVALGSYMLWLTQQEEEEDTGVYYFVGPILLGGGILMIVW